MTSLDASSLVTDVDGIRFLASVLEVTTSSALPRTGFTLGGPRHGWTIEGGDAQPERVDVETLAVAAA